MLFRSTGKVGLGYRDVRGVDHNFISVQGTASARAGAGIGGSWSLMYRDGKLVAGASLAATWGIGAGVGAEVVFNISELATALFSSSKFADSMYTAGSKFVDIVGAAMKAAGVDARTTALELFRALRANGFGLKTAYHYVMD